MTQTILNAMVSAAAGGTVALLLWLTIRRWIERQDSRVDRLETGLETMRDTQLKRVENGVARGEDARAKIYGDISEIRQTFVHKKECKEMRDAQMAAANEFRASVLKLERVGERADSALKRAEELQQEFVHVTSQIAVVAAQVEQIQKSMQEAK
jgi:chromosome segregation ATPase